MKEGNLAVWDSVLADVGSDGLHIASESYPDEEMLGLLNCASCHYKRDVESTLRSLGSFMVPHFALYYPMFFADHKSLLTFLPTIDAVVHLEVKKLYPDAKLPSFICSPDPQQKQITMEYSSERKLCALAEGLIEGSAAHFKETITLAHDQCMHRGDASCRLQITIT